MFSFKSLLEMPRWEALLVVLVLIAGMGYTIISLGWLPHMSIVTAISALLAYGLCRGLKYGDMQNGMVGAVGQGMGAIYLFFFIGLMVSALMMSGAIPTLMYYGFGLISPTYFYFSAFALCSVIGVAIGSSLTTCATVGVAFMGMGAAFHADLAMTAGAIVSGAFFGDKMSPLSDTTGIAASIVGLLVVLALMRVNAVVAMLFTIAAALAVTYFHSTPGLQQLGAWFYSGYKLEGDAFKDIAKLISRGGLESMFFTQTIVILGMSLGGLLFAVGVIPSLLDAVRAFLSNAGRATFSVAATSVGVNFLIGEQYLSILLAGETFKPVYDKLGLHSRNLSRTLEDAGTVINPLVPWSVCGVFISHALNVPVWEYLPYAFFCYLCLVLTLLFGWTGFTLTKK